MAEFNFDSLDISRVNNETIAELGEILGSILRFIAKSI